MQVHNQTDFTFGAFPGRLDFPAHSLTIVVKGAFDLVPGGVARLAEEPVYPTGDEFYPGDEEQTGSVRYESDFAFRKERADVMLVGNCHPPGDEPVKHCLVSFGVGNLRRVLRVSGDRFWKSGWLVKTVLGPEPFTTMPIRYEYAFGGPKDKRNPVGRGTEVFRNEKGEKLQAIPNLEEPPHIVKTPKDRPEPASFGPLSRAWSDRASKLGTYKGRYLKERWPWYPTDFDWSHHSGAPERQQVAGFLKGDEEVHFKHLHPTHAEYSSRLPGVRPRCFVNEEAKGEKERRFREVSLVLDTCWIDAEAERLILVWRGAIPIEAPEFEELDHCLLLAEDLRRPPSSSETCRELLDGILAQKDAPPDEQPEEPPEVVAAPAGRIAGDDAEFEAEMEKTRAQFIAAGVDPDKPPTLTPEQEQERDRILAEMEAEAGLDEEELEPEPWTRERVAAAHGAGEPLAGEDLSGLDLNGLDLSGADLTSATLTGAILAGANLSEARLTEARLADADLSGTDLSKAVLAGANLTAARLPGANLTEADVSEARLDRADLSDAVLENAVFDAAVLTGAVLDRVQTSYTRFSNAELSGASFVEALLDYAVFSEATLDGAVFRNAVLTSASVEGARGEGVDMEDADLTKFRASEGASLPGGKFRGAFGDGGNWDEADLTGADFSWTRLGDTTFEKATLAGANLEGADFRHSRFRRAILREARMVTMNLFRGSLERADLTGADLSGSNLYEAELLDADFSETRTDGTNLKMTKLART